MYIPTLGRCFLHHTKKFRPWKITTFGDITLCSQLGTYQRFGVTYSLQLQSPNWRWRFFYATLVPVYQTLWRHIPEHRNAVIFYHLCHPIKQNIALIYRTTWRYQTGLCNGDVLDSYRKVFGSNYCWNTSNSDRLFSQFLRANAEIVPRLFHDRFPPDSF
jgi:hypothetical protein